VELAAWRTKQGEGAGWTAILAWEVRAQHAAGQRLGHLEKFTVGGTSQREGGWMEGVAVPTGNQVLGFHGRY